MSEAVFSYGLLFDSAMDDFRLRVFVEVARRLNFTKAAQELFISQPAVTKHIQELESLFRVQLFERSGGRIALTGAGRLLLARAETILEGYRRLKLEMNLLTDSFDGELRLGASTTIAQYLLPEVMARYIARYPDVKLSLMTCNSRQVEEALSDQRIDLGLVEGCSHQPGLKYTRFADDELVLVTGARNAAAREEISLEELLSLPLVLRETGSGTLEVIEQALAAHHVRLSQLRILLQMGTTEGIKSFLAGSDAYAIVSVVAVARELAEGRLRVVEVNGLELKREFAFVHPQGGGHELAEHFMRFASLVPLYG